MELLSVSVAVMVCVPVAIRTGVVKVLNRHRPPQRRSWPA